MVQSNDPPELAFEVETTTHKNKNTENEVSGPVNVKVKLKNPKQDGAKALVIQSTNKHKTPEVVQLHDSNQTIMSFDVFMEDEHKLKPTKSVLGKSTPQTQKETYYNATNLNSSKPSAVWFLGGKCKPGGCLDPRAADEDQYAYDVAKVNENVTSVAAGAPKDQKTKSQSTSAEKIKRSTSSSFCSFLQRNKNRSKNSMHDQNDPQDESRGNVEDSASGSTIAQPQKWDDSLDRKKSFERREYRLSSDPLYKPKKSSDTEQAQKLNEHDKNWPNSPNFIPIPVPIPIGGLNRHDKQQTNDDDRLGAKTKEIKDEKSIDTKTKTSRGKINDTSHSSASPHSRSPSRFDSTSVVSDKRQAKVSKKNSQSSAKLSKTSKESSPTRSSGSADRKNDFATNSLPQGKSKISNKYPNVIPIPVPVPIPLNLNKNKSEHSTKTNKDGNISETGSKISKDLKCKENDSSQESLQKIKKKNSQGGDNTRLSQTTKDISPTRYKVDSTKSKTSKETSPSRISNANNNKTSKDVSPSRTSNAKSNKILIDTSPSRTSHAKSKKTSKDTSPSRISNSKSNKTSKDASPTRYNASPNRKSSAALDASSHVSSKNPSEFQNNIPVPMSIPIPVTLDKSKHEIRQTQAKDRSSPFINCQQDTRSRFDATSLTSDINQENARRKHSREIDNVQSDKTSKNVSPTRHAKDSSRISKTSKDVSPTRSCGGSCRKASTVTSQSMQDKSNIPSQYPYIIPISIPITVDKKFTTNNSSGRQSNVSRTSKDIVSDMNRKNQMKTESMMHGSDQNSYFIQGSTKSDTLIPSSKQSYHQNDVDKAHDFYSPTQIATDKSNKSISGSAKDLGGNKSYLPAVIGTEKSDNNYYSPTALGTQQSEKSYYSPTAVVTQQSEKSYHLPTALGTQQSENSYYSPTALGTQQSEKSYYSPTAVGTQQSEKSFYSPTALGIQKTETSLSGSRINLSGSKSATNKSSKANITNSDKSSSRSQVDSTMNNHDSKNYERSEKGFRDTELSIKDREISRSSTEIVTKKISSFSKNTTRKSSQSYIPPNNIPRSQPDSPSIKTDSKNTRNSDLYSGSHDLAPDQNKTKLGKDAMDGNQFYTPTSIGEVGVDEDSRRSISFKENKDKLNALTGAKSNDTNIKDIYNDDNVYKGTNIAPYADLNVKTRLDLKRTDAIYLNFGLESKRNDENEVFFNTFDPTRKNSTDTSSKNLIVMQTTVQNFNSVIKFPIDAENELNISFSKINKDGLLHSEPKFSKIQSQDRIKDQNYMKTEPQSVDMDEHNTESRTKFQTDVSAKQTNEYPAHDQVSFEDQKSLKLKRKNKNELLSDYVKEMLSLQGVIKDVRLEIDKLALQQSLLREKITKSGLSKNSRFHSHTMIKTKQKCCAASTCTLRNKDSR